MSEIHCSPPWEPEMNRWNARRPWQSCRPSVIPSRSLVPAAASSFWTRMARRHYGHLVLVGWFGCWFPVASARTKGPNDGSWPDPVPSAKNSGKAKAMVVVWCWSLPRPPTPSSPTPSYPFHQAPNPSRSPCRHHDCAGTEESSRSKRPLGEHWEDEGQEF